MSDEKYCSVPVPEGLSSQAVRFLLSPRLDDFPIPKVAFRGEAWPPILSEIADHIGERDALTICDVFGGADIYVSQRISSSPFAGVISPKNVEKMTQVFNRERLSIPSTNIVRRAKLHSVLSLSVSGEVSRAMASAICQMPRRHFVREINHSDDWKEVAPAVLPEPRIIVALRKASEIAGDALAACGAPEAEVQNITSSIMGLWFDYRFPKREEDNEHSGE